MLSHLIFITSATISCLVFISAFYSFNVLFLVIFHFPSIHWIRFINGSFYDRVRFWDTDHWTSHLLIFAVDLLLILASLRADRGRFGSSVITMSASVIAGFRSFSSLILWYSGRFTNDSRRHLSQKSPTTFCSFDGLIVIKRSDKLPVIL